MIAGFGCLQLVLDRGECEDWFDSTGIVVMTFIAIMALGQTLVIITGGIDLSVGSLIALSAVTAAWLIRAGGATPLAHGRRRVGVFVLERRLLPGRRLRIPLEL